MPKRKKIRHETHEIVSGLHAEGIHLCTKCGYPTIARADRSKESEHVIWAGMDHTKKKPQRMWMYPSTLRYCSHCCIVFSSGKPMPRENDLAVHPSMLPTKNVVTKIKRIMTKIKRIISI